jgi:LPS sulfotransferase NodH
LASNIATNILSSYPFYSEGEDEGEEPIMIIGCGRSGNTLLRSMLVAGGELTIPPESYILASLSRHYNLWRFKKWTEICDLVCGKLTSHPEFKVWNTDLSDVLAKAYELPESSRSLQSIIKLIYIHYGQAHELGLTRWGDKTPLNTLYLDDISRMMPQAKYIHIIRDPRAVACSYVKAAQVNDAINESTYELAANRWLASIKAVQKFKRGKLGANLIEIKYEDLVLDAEATLKRICDFTNLKFSTHMLSHDKLNMNLGDVEHYQHHEHSKKALDASRISAWAEHMASDDKKLVENKVKNAVLPYNYF